MKRLRSKLSQYNNPKDENYTKNLRKIIFENKATNKLDDYYAILNDSRNDIVLRFSAFYCIFTQSRRFEQRYQLFELVETYINLFNSDEFSYLQNIVWSQYNKFRYLDSSSKSYYKKALEYGKKAIDEYKFKSNNIGCFNNYADIVLDAMAYNNIVQDEDVCDAIQYVDRAILIHEKERNLPPYANYYCSKARLYAYQEKYDEARKMITLAISYEKADQYDSLVRISNYHNIRLEINTNEALKLVKANVTNSQEQFMKIQNRLDEQQSKYIEILGFFTTTIAIIIGNINIALNFKDFSVASALILILTGCLIFAYSILKVLFSSKGSVSKNIIPCLLSILFIFIGVLMGKGII